MFVGWVELELCISEVYTSFLSIVCADLLLGVF
jgi:hypothetical protein